MIPRRDALLGLLGLPALALAGCAPHGGAVSRRTAAGGGEEGGIGGTGVFGTVTGIGSVLVNGLRLETWAGTAVESLAGRGAPVLPGDAVAAEVVRDADRLLATRLAVFHPLVGPLERMAEGALGVLGTRVVLPPGVAVRGPRGEEAPTTALRPGVTVAVSGLWDRDAVVAGAIRVLQPDLARQAVLRGQLRRTVAGLVVGGTRLLGQGPQDGIETDRFVTIQGAPQDGGALRVEAIDERPVGVFSGRVAALAVEGFLAPNRLDPGFHLAGFGLPLDPASRVPLRPGVRHLFLGRYQDGFRVDAGLALPAEAAARAAALAGPEVAAAIAGWLG